MRKKLENQVAPFIYNLYYNNIMPLAKFAIICVMNTYYLVPDWSFKPNGFPTQFGAKMLVEIYAVSIETRMLSAARINSRFGGARD